MKTHRQALPHGERRFWQNSASYNELTEFSLKVVPLETHLREQIPAVLITPVNYSVHETGWTSSHCAANFAPHFENAHVMPFVGNNLTEDNQWTTTYRTKKN